LRQAPRHVRHATKQRVLIGALAAHEQDVHAFSACHALLNINILKRTEARLAP
jgi:hypothetical protein